MAYLTQERADQLAREWLESWNSHNLGRIMGHYNEQIEFVSPFVVKLLNDRTGTVRGKEALIDYFSKGLAKYPNLTFHLHKVFLGVRSLTVYYESVNNLMAAETMELDDRGLITRVLAHYAPK
ncbi:MAG: nuclear transport factor 2 family protein [Nitrospira sp.]|nr:nuclear transport factor 2 family protein [Nitrospira sp.]